MWRMVLVTSILLWAIAVVTPISGGREVQNFILIPSGWIKESCCPAAEMPLPEDITIDNLATRNDRFVPRRWFIRIGDGPEPLWHARIHIWGHDSPIKIVMLKAAGPTFISHRFAFWEKTPTYGSNKAGCFPIIGVGKADFSRCSRVISPPGTAKYIGAAGEIELVIGVFKRPVLQSPDTYDSERKNGNGNRGAGRSTGKTILGCLFFIFGSALMKLAYYFIDTPTPKRDDMWLATVSGFIAALLIVQGTILALSGNWMP